MFRYTVGDTSVSWFFFFAGWGLTYLFLAAGHRMQGAERLRAEAELQALRYQLNPHFLFNALNTLAELVAEDSEAAERMVLDLSALLRRMLTDAPTATVSLAEELALQRHYLAIEGRRFSDLLTFAIEVPDALSHRPVPALILQPLVENAVKHGVDRRVGPVHVVIRASANGRHLTLAVENSCGASAGDRAGFGIGLANTRQRLRLLYGEDASFVAGPVAAGWRATVSLPDG